MAKLKDLFDALHEDTVLSTPNEIVAACKLIMEVQELNFGERDCIRTSFERGPLFDGDVPSKSDRDSLVEKGFIEHVVVKGEWGYNACTYKGAWAKMLIDVGQASAYDK